MLFIILGSSLSVFLLIGFEVIFGRLQLLVLLFRFCFIIVLALYSCLPFVRERVLCYVMPCLLFKFRVVVFV